MQFKKAVFLDRDGIINEPIVKGGKPFSPESVEQFKFCSGISELSNQLVDCDFILFIVTNQPEVARGTILKRKVEEIHDHIRSALPIKEIMSCYHDDQDNCECRKPKPGAIINACRRYFLEPEKSYMIGDRWKDIDAGNAAGCKTIFLDRGYNERKPTTQNYTVSSIKEVVDIISKDRL